MNSSNDHPSKNLKQFWIEHDRSLSAKDEVADADLSHDLYRGMPVWFNRFFADFQRQAIQRLFSRAKIPQNSQALDLGCGTGRWCDWLSGHGMQTTGLDIGLHAVLLASQRLQNSRFACACLPNIPVANASFDLVTSIMVLQHLKHEDQWTALDEVRRVLKPAGYFLTCEMVDTHDPAAHIISHSNSDWRDMFVKSGFEIIGVTASEYLPFVKTYHFLTNLRGKENNNGVKQVGALMNRSKIANLLFHAVILAAYPLEWAVSAVFPPHWARLNVFLVRRI